MSLMSLTAVALGKKIQAGEVTVEEAVLDALEQIEEKEDTIHSYVTVLEKEAILNSYKILLKTCNFNLQILIHTNKEDISKIVSNVKKSNNDSISIISKKYIEFLNKINSEKQTSTKNYYIIIDEQSEIENENLANIYYMLNEKYFKIKECLNKCGNQVKECKKEDVIKVLHFFLNTNYNLNR